MIVADTHLHVYPQYSLTSVVFHAEQNIREALGASVKELSQIVLCICDRTHFPTLRENLRLLGHDLSAAEDDAPQLFRFEGKGTPIALLESKQWVTREGFEILGLGSALGLPDGLRAVEVVRALKAEGATAVLPWSPGKWMFQRGKLLRETLAELSVEDVALGDIFMRPACTLPPAIMTSFRKHGGRVLYGSDPLPAFREERLAGSYTSVFQGPALTTAAEAAFLMRTKECSPLGHRATLPLFVNRMVKAFRAKHVATPV